MITRRKLYDPNQKQLLITSRWCETIITLLLLLLLLLFLVVDTTRYDVATVAAAGNNNQNNYKDNNSNYYYKNRGQPASTRSTLSTSATTLPPPPPPPLPQRQPNEQEVPWATMESSSNDSYWDELESSPLSAFEDARPSTTRPAPSQQQQQQQQQQQTSSPQNRRPFQPILQSGMERQKGSALPSIHYSFPQRSTTNIVGSDETHLKRFSSSSKSLYNNRDDSTTTTSSTTPKFASARKDIVTQYITASFLNRCYVTCCSAMVGCTVTAFIERSLLGCAPSLLILIVTSVIFAIFTWLRNNIYGELIRAISLAMIFSFQRSIQIRNQYPAYQYLLNAILGDNPQNQRRRRKPFPPTNNPWAWSNLDTDDDDDTNEANIEFQMIPTVIAMAFIGSIIGTNVPILPSSFGALLGAASFAYTTTLSSSRGDLCRCMGMRVVAFVREFITIANTDLHLPNKSAIVASAILDKLLILDRQHSIRQRIGRGISTLIDTVSRIQRDMQQEPKSSSSPPKQGSSDNQRRRSTYDDIDDGFRSGSDPGSRSPRNDEAPSSRPQSRQSTFKDRERNVSTGRRESTGTATQSLTPDGFSQREKTSGGGWFSGWTKTKQKVPSPESDVNYDEEISKDFDDDEYKYNNEISR